MPLTSSQSMKLLKKSLIEKGVAATAAIGDNLNDAAQIQAAGTGVAVANAKPEIKAIADVVLKTTNNEAAIADFLKNYA